MKCLHCNQELEEGAAFCPSCGEPVGGASSVKKISLMCENCSGTLTVDSDSDVLVCPYCGHKALIVETEAVKMARIRMEANKEIELAKIESQKAGKEEQERNERGQKFKKSFKAKLLLVMVVFCAFVMIRYFTEGNVGLGFLGILPTVFFALSWAMGMQFIPEKKPNMHSIFTLLAWISLIVVIAVDEQEPQVDPVTPPTPTQEKDVVDVFKDWTDIGDLGNYNPYSYYTGQEELEWNRLEMSKYLPELPSTKGIIWYDVKDAAEVWVWDVNSGETFDAYRDACIEMGYTIDYDKQLDYYQAYNEDGYKTTLTYDAEDSVMRVALDYPKPFADISWPTMGVAKDVPAFTGHKGFIEYDSDTNFTVYYEKVTKEELKAYAELVKEAGFDNDYYCYEDGFSGKDGNGKVVYGYLKGFQTLELNVYIWNY